MMQVLAILIVVVLEKVVVAMAWMTVMAVTVMKEVMTDMMVGVVRMAVLVITGLFRGAPCPHGSHVKT